MSSNVARADYAGSAACRPCHPDAFAAWERSPMHRMTRDARGATVLAPFDGTRWSFGGDTAVLDQKGGERFVRIKPARGPARTYRLTRVIGGRTREDFAGVDANGGADEMVLPISYVFRTHALRYKGYSVMIHERDELRAGPVWSQACIFCHNTVPEIDRWLGAIAGPRAPPYQGVLVEGWLAPERRARAAVDPLGLGRVLGAEVALLGGSLPPSGAPPSSEARAAIGVIRSGFDGHALVEEGIGCEACHGGAREHTQVPAQRPSFVPRAPWLDVRPPEVSARGWYPATVGPARARAPETAPAPGSWTRAQAINRVCARCHQVLFSRYPYTWEGGRRDEMAGGSSINSGEARDFLLGGCADAMSCVDCHRPHAPASDIPPSDQNATCTRCHRELGAPARLRAHAHHDPDGPAGLCVACHMPRKNMGLDGRLTRYHRVGSPTDPARVLGDRPLECALCHADRSVAELVDAMEAWWPVRYPRQRLVELYGTLDANVLRATIEHGKAHEKVVAMAVLGEAGARDAAPLIARELRSEFPLVREWAQSALTRACRGPASPSSGAAALAACETSPGPPVPRSSIPASSAEDPED